MKTLHSFFPEFRNVVLVSSNMWLRPCMSGQRKMFYKEDEIKINAITLTAAATITILSQYKISAWDHLECTLKTITYMVWHQGKIIIKELPLETLWKEYFESTSIAVTPFEWHSHSTRRRTNFPFSNVVVLNQFRFDQPLKITFHRQNYFYRRKRKREKTINNLQSKMCHSNTIGK